MVGGVIIATWNVNSIRAREARFLAFLERWKPDVVCLQELKVEDAQFPVMQVKGLGYHAAFHGQRTYNGVAIVAKEEHALEDVHVGLGDDVEDDHARLIGATVGGVHLLSAYFPNGGSMGSDKYVYKRAWMKRLRAYLDRRFAPTDPVALLGDYNVAPFADDVADPENLEGTVLANPEIREALAHVAAFGLEDVCRPFHPKGGVYTWWDYRARGFERNLGLRIDHVYASPPVAARVVGAVVDREERHGKGASDHAPLLVELA